MTTVRCGPSVAAQRDKAYPANAWYVAVLLTFAYALSLGDRVILSLMVSPIQADLHISDTQFGVLTGLAFVVFYSIAGYPLGWLADRHSRRLVVSAGVALWSAMTAFCGFATTFNHLLLARIGVGIGEAALLPCAFSMMADMFPPNMLGKAGGLFQTGSMLGAGLAFAFGGAMVDATSVRLDVALPIIGAVRSWQAVFLIMGAPGLALALLFLLIREPPRTAMLGPLGNGDEASSAALFKFIRSNWLVLASVLLGAASLSMVTVAFWTWMPELFIRHYRFSPSKSGLVMGAATGVFGAAGFIFGGLIGDHLLDGGRADAAVRIGTWSAMSAIPFALLASLGGGGIASIVGVCGFFLTGYLYGAPVTAGLQLITSPCLRGRLSALFFLTLNLFAIGIGAASVGFLNDHVFQDRYAIDRSLASVAIVMLPVSWVAFRFALRPFAKAMEAVDQMSTETGAVEPR